MMRADPPSDPIATLASDPIATLAIDPIATLAIDPIATLAIDPIATLVGGDRDLELILALQRRNREPTVDGFVTVPHTLPILQAMHGLMPSLIVRGEEGGLAGYALAMAREAQSLLPILAPMFARLEGLAALRGERWYVMGQVCVDAAWRGRGVFDALYAGHRTWYGGGFDVLVTEIATRNGRSIRAHARAGFEEIDRYRDATDEWSVVAWRWPQRPALDAWTR